jgi:hypothetical protein
MGLFYRTIRIVENGIKPAYIFDGKPPELKSGVVSLGHVSIEYVANFQFLFVPSSQSGSKDEQKRERKERKQRRLVSSPHVSGPP